MGLLPAAVSATGYAAAADTSPVDVASIVAEGTQFRVTLTDGRVLRSAALVGANLIVALPSGSTKVRIAAVERDPDAKTDDIWLHTLLTELPDGSSQSMCDPGPDGRRQGFPIATSWDVDGTAHAVAPEEFDIVCTSGARAKCVRFGYRPWVPAELELHGACTRMVRADYCGNAVATTRDGTVIDMFDDRRIQTADNDPAQEFEAGWAPKGAVCVRHVRVKENISLESLAASCPRLAEKVGSMCTEGVARSLGARLFNRSRP
jgi:hypothetical protein